MTKKPKLDPATQTPQKKSDIDKMYIVEYTKLHGTSKQKEDLKKFIKEHTVEKTNHLTGKPYKDIELKEVRTEFCKMFFPQFVDKKNNKKSFFDLVDEL